MTRQERQIVEFIGRYIEENGWAPTVREIGAATGIGSPGSVHAYLGRLEAKGIIRRRHGAPQANSRALCLVPASGRDAAGFPRVSGEDSTPDKETETSAAWPSFS